MYNTHPSISPVASISHEDDIVMNRTVDEQGDAYGLCHWYFRGDGYGALATILIEFEVGSDTALNSAFFFGISFVCISPFARN